MECYNLQQKITKAELRGRIYVALANKIGDKKVNENITGLLKEEWIE